MASQGTVPGDQPVLSGPVPTSADDDRHWRRLESLFDGALAVPEPERAAWLASACPDDAALRAEVARMLDAHRQSGGILDLPLTTPNSDAKRTDALTARLAAAIGDRYVIERELGRGGAAVVFLAEERKHARRVVLKVLRPELAAWLGTQRFVREVHIAASLAHPHIVGLIDSGDADGLLYYVMPYVEGETLRTRLRRRGTLPVGETVGMLFDMADALAHAHDVGIVHRDLKPENVLCAGEHAYLLDFGIAKVAMATLDAEHATQDGTAVGTPAYMAPEQRGGDGEVDHRADLYAWGVLAYEMLTGTRPEPAAATAAGDTLRLRGDVPRALAAIVEACLAPDPAARPADAREVVTALAPLAMPRASRRTSAVRQAVEPRASHRRRWAAVAVAVAAVGAAYAWRARAAGVTAPIAAPIAVAALTNETGDSTLDAWGRMAGDWITQGLQETGRIQVVSWPTALGVSERLRADRAAGRAVDPVATLRDETGAGTVVTGAYYLVDDSLRVTVEVTDARDGRLLGAPAPLVVPRDSAHLAVRAIRDRLMAAVAIWSDDRFATIPDLGRRPPTFAAYQLFDRALEHFMAQRYAESAPGFREAYASDTTFLVPLLYAATAYWNTGDLARADSMSRFVRARGAMLGDYHRGWAQYVEARLVGDGTRALAAIQRTAELAAGSRAWYNLAALALEMDRPQEALAALERLDPDRGDMRQWSSYWTQLTHALHLTGAHERELVAARALRARFPDRRVGLVLEARALGALGRAAALDSLVATALALPAATYWSQGGALVVGGEELVAHGDAAAGRERIVRGVEWLRRQLLATPNDRSHRYWLGAALYDLQQWEESGRVFAGLAREFPDRLQYRAMDALAAARRGLPDAEARLGTAGPHERGAHAAYRARLAAVRGDEARAVSLLAESVRDGVDGLPWMHAEGYHDLAALAAHRDALPFSLRPRSAPAR